MRDRPAGDFDYEAGGRTYARTRRADPRIAAQIHAAFGDARTVLNVGAGAGSYEPTDRHVVAVEPSATMRAQRPRHLAPAIRVSAEALPFDDGAFDAALASLTVHQWPDLERGLAELRRVTRGPVVVMTFDTDVFAQFWLAEYAPAIMEHDGRRMPPLARIAAGLGAPARIEMVPIPLDCADGFNEAYYGRPEGLLNPQVRAGQSVWGFLAPGEEARIVAHLAADLASGEWDRRHGHLRTQPTYDGSLRLLISEPA